MTKGTKSAEATGKATTLKLTPEQEAVVKGFSEDERKAFDALANDERRVETLELMLSTKAALVIADQVDFDEVDSGEDREEIQIFSAGGLGCPKGTVIVAEFLGTMPMFSMKPKENWDKETEPTSGNNFWRNQYYLFRDQKTGRKFGLYKAPCLNKVLPKLPTAESCRTVGKNPLVKIEYIGKVVGKDVLKEKYDLEIQSGNEAHVHIVSLQKGVKFDRYARGVKNYLKAPLPNFGEAEKLNHISQAQKDWEQLEMLNSVQRPSIDSGERRALTQ
jgi:hypothetical protein